MLGEKYNPSKPTIVSRWVTDKGLARKLANFFVKNVSTSYISHSELIMGRAATLKSWNKNFHQMIFKELQTKITKRQTKLTNYRIAVATEKAKIIALAIVQFLPKNNNGFIEDFIVDSSRREQGIGSVFLAWIEEEARANGIGRIFLESGINNRPAHHFFESKKYINCSKIFFKVL